jgi:predicted ribosome quality control (RQC) complex YloA/Tae2 family protein
LATAKRSGDSVIVPDPYDPDGKPIAVPVGGGMSHADAAAACFRHYRKARRGRERVAVRAGQVAEQQARLERVVASVPPTPTWDDIEQLEEKMREAGIPVALEASPRAARAARSHRPRVEGARIFRSSDGWTVLVGKSGKDNARLTFKLSAPDDFWLHAHGVPGAHVVIRNDGRRPRPPKATLHEAAAVAAWFSEAQKEAEVDVQWTRRKYVRKIHGASPGTVRLKKFEIVRIRPELPEELDLGHPGS